MALAGAHTVHYLCKELEFLAHKVFPLIVRPPPSAAGRRLVDDATYLKRRAKSNGKLLVIEIVTFASSFSNAHCVRFWGARVSLFAHSNGYAHEIMHSAWLARPDSRELGQEWMRRRRRLRGRRLLGNWGGHPAPQ